MKPQFAPGKDMSDVSPQDVADAKRRAKEAKAHDKATTTKPAPKKYAKGGSVRGDGCATKGKTKGRMV
jgi:hypothetical protein